MADTFWERLFRGVRRLRQKPYWPQFAGPDWADRIMAVTSNDWSHSKQGRTICRWTVQAEDGRRLVVYLKRHYRLPFWDGIRALFRPERARSPALQEWKHLERAQQAGLPVPVPAAAGEFIGPWGKLRSFIAVEELTGMLPLHQAVPAAAQRLGPLQFRRWKRSLIREIARLALELHRRNWFHKDLYLCHYYIPEADTFRIPQWRGRVWLIDLHRLSRHGWTAPWWRSKDLAQLLYSTDEPGIDNRDRLWFWKCYRRGAWGRRRARLLRWWVRLKAWNYRRLGRRTG
jgi:Lipopolysaccharide kinase (Kdo/WaaP) family